MIFGNPNPYMARDKNKLVPQLLPGQDPSELYSLITQNGKIMNICKELPLRGARPSSLATPSELDFPTFSTQTERTLVASYIGAVHAQSATPMELLNFYASRSVLRKLQGTAPQQQSCRIAKATLPPAQAVNGLAIYVGQFEKKFQSGCTPDPHIQTMAPYLYPPPPAFSPLVGFLRL